MVKSNLVRRLLLLLIAAVAVATSTANAGGDSTCRAGSMAEYMADGTCEFEMDSEFNSRILAANPQHVISYGALEGDSIPCSRRGSSYGNCRPAAVANPYRRGCSAATHCRS